MIYLKSIVLLTVVTCATAIDLGATYELARQDTPTNFCQGCRSMVSFLSSFNSTANRAEQKNLFARYCEMYYPVSTDFRQGPCPLFVDSLFYVMDRIDPIHHCDDIGACGLTDDEGPFSPLRQSVATVQRGSPLTDNNIAAINKLDGIICDVCEQVVVQVRTQLQDPRMIAYIHKRANDLCDYLKIVDQDEYCRSSVGKYIDEAIDFIQNIDPLKYCRSIQLCNRNESLHQTKLIRPLSLSVPELGDIMDLGIQLDTKIGQQPEKGPNCLFCKTFVKEMFRFLHENRTEQSVSKALDTACDLFYKPGPRLTHCKELVSTYSKELIELLIDETNPEVVCMLLEQCTYKGDKGIRKPEPKKLAAPTMSEFIVSLDPSIKKESMRTCVECKIFIKYLKNTLDDPRSIETVKDYLINNLCSKIGNDTMEASCQKFVDEYAKVFFKALVEDLNPQAACVDLGACREKKWRTFLIDTTQATTDYSTQSTTLLVPKPKEGYLCDQCVDIVTQIDEYLSTHPIDHDVSTLIDQVCNKLPSEMVKQECTVLVNTFGQDIAQAIATMDNPRQLCAKIDLC